MAEKNYYEMGKINPMGLKGEDRSAERMKL